VCPPLEIWSAPRNLQRSDYDRDQNHRKPRPIQISKVTAVGRLDFHYKTKLLAALVDGPAPSVFVCMEKDMPDDYPTYVVFNGDHPQFAVFTAMRLIEGAFAVLAEVKTRPPECRAGE
jgi:hypothetical protein